MEYTIILKKTPDNYYVASCPSIPEAIAQGKTYEECIANAREVIELCLEYRAQEYCG